ncbi:MAG: hypothetical protein LLG01_17390 [Planctomycetaceae bacterium]|nr:hypothetical protein [Planctomycetaceae bacterium]
MSGTRFIATLILTLTAAAAWAQPGPYGAAPAGMPPMAAPNPQPHPYGAAVTEAQETELLKVLEDKRPEAHSRLMTLKENDAAAYQRMLQELLRWYEKVRKLPKDVQAATVYLTESRQRIYRLARELANADSEGDREQSRLRLREEIAREFDAEQITQTYRLKQLQQDMDTMRTGLERRAAQREQQIESRYKRALERADRIRLHKQRPGDEAGLEALTFPPAALRGHEPVPTATPSGAAPAKTGSDIKHSPARGGEGERRAGRERPRPSFSGGPSDHDLAAMLDALKEKRPEYYARLTALEQSSPEAYRRLVRATWQWYLRWRAMPKDVQGPALIAADSRLAVEGLTLQLAKAASDSQRSQLKETLKKTIAAGFDAETTVETNGLKTLQARLVQMQAELDEHAKNRSEIIDQRFKQHTESSHRVWRRGPRLPESDRPAPPPAPAPKPAQPQPPLPESDG